MDENKMGVEQELYLAPENEEKSEFSSEENPKIAKENLVLHKANGTKMVRRNEIPELRGKNRKVFRMSDGTEQAVFAATDLHVFDEQTQSYQEIDTTLREGDDGNYYTSGKNSFLAKFSREEGSDELFSIENGLHRVTVFSKKNKKNKNKCVRPEIKNKKHGETSMDIISFVDVEKGADYDYSIEGNGVKEEIIVKDKGAVYNYPFIMRCENVTARFDEENMRVAFLSNETGEEVFFIPAPYMTDANGITSNAVSYAVRKVEGGDVHMSVIADSQWMNSKERTFPVIIDPQIKLSGSTNMTTYSWNDGYMQTESYHKLGVVGYVAENYSTNAVYNTGFANTMSTAILLSLNSWSSGTIACSGDQVWYKFTTPESGSYTISTEGDLDTMGYLYDVNGCMITSNDDCNGRNFSITANLNGNTTYYFMVRAWSSNTGSYSVGVTHQSSSGSSQDGSDVVNGTLLSLNNWVSGSISHSNEEVWYTFKASAGSGNYVIGTKGSMDTVGYLYDSNYCLVASNDDYNGLNFKITHYLTSGNTYYLKVKAYSDKTGSYTVGVSTECIDGGYEPTISYSPQRIYMSFNMPTLPRNPRIKKAELKFYQKDGRADSGTSVKIGLYQVTGSINLGNSTPTNISNLIDFAELKTETYSEGVRTSYSFDITTLIDKINKGESSYQRLMLKLLDESVSYENFVELYGSTSSVSPPEIVLTYESSYGVNTSYRTHTHELGRFGQGSIDLQCGNLMFESEDFAWGGNRMPVTIKHLYNSALASYQYTNNSSIKLSTATFSAMKLGYGYKLNIMQSMKEETFYHDGEKYTGYVYIGENGEETYFKPSTQQAFDDGNCQCYNLYEDVTGGDMIFDPVKFTLKSGEEIYQFDTMGRLIQIMDESGNHMYITYTSNRITTVTDGAGRDFNFAYDSSGYLTSITAPDGKSILYTYSGNLLSTITYQDGKKVTFTYSSNKPASVTLLDANGNNVYKVAYSYSGNRLYSVMEYGVENGAFVQGVNSIYTYSAASGRTIVQTYELIDDVEFADCYEATVKTVYTFDNEGNIASQYVYSEDTGKVGANGEESGINPHSGDSGAGVVSNINNLLADHSFQTLNSWPGMSNNSGNLYINNYADESYTKFGKKLLRMESYTADCTENGVYQVTCSLPVGEYTFSAYARIRNAFSGTENKGAYIRVATTEGTVLAESEHIFESDGEYIRLIAPFEIKTAQSVQVQLLVNGKGTVYFDAPQLENNPFANAYNILENGNFELSTAWTRSGSHYSSGTCFNMKRSMCFNGNVEQERNAYQRVYVKSNRDTRESFTLSGWAKGYGLPIHEDGVKTTFRLRAKIKYSDSYYSDYSTEEYTANFSIRTEEWQLASVEFAKSKYRTVEYIDIYLDYDHNFGTAYFDDIQLVRNSIETNLSVEDFETEPEEQTTEPTVKEAEPENKEDNEFKEKTDTYGNALTETTFTDGEFGAIYRAFKYNADTNGIDGNDAGNDLISETDARGNVTNYTVDGDTSRNEEITDRCGNKTAYEYDESGKTTKVTSKDKNDTVLANVSYAYDAFDNMTEIVRGDGMKYVLAYNAYHNLESIGIEGKTDGDLIKYTYKKGNGRLKEMTYTNGDRMTATYNDIGQMVAEKWYNSSDELTAHYKYVYDGQGNIVRSIDILGQKEYNYEYDAGKVVRATECNIVLSDEMVVSKSLVNTVKYYYDADDKMTKKVITSASGSVQTIYYENNEDNTVVKFNAGGKTITAHSKTDSFGRKVFDELQLGTGFVSRQFHYHAGVATEEHVDNNMLKSSPTTQLVSQIVLSGGRTISYEYDEEERITKVDDNVDGITAYTYDAFGQLITETVNGITTKFEYDNYGNILAKGVADETGEIAEETKVTYVYGDDTWKDLLTAYNGQSIVYDAQGNPTSYLGHTLTWEKGRQLKSFDNIAYTYNANGIRTSKTVDGIKHTYTLDGTKILREEWAGNTLVPLYDNEETVCGILYNNEPYYFQKNLQGDIIGIVDKSSKVVANYSYDAWGVPTITQDSTDCGIAQINPYRYRGYYFDGENGMYYLQTRYYNPSVCRFINSDEAILLGASETILGCNLITYCENSSLSLSDSFGTDAYWITDTKTLAGLGHSSLLVYTNNAWYYFYFGAKQFLKPFNGPANVIFEKVGITFIKNRKFDYSKLNKRLKGQDGNKIFTGSKKYQGNGYDKSVYIRGDFTSTYRYVNNTVKRMKYNLLKENCSWLCIEILRNSSICSSKKQKLENLQYRYTFKYVRISKYTMTGMWRLVKISNTLIPSTVHKRIVSIFA